MKASNLLKRDIDIVKNRKVIFIIPAIVMAIALIAGVLWGIFTGQPIKVSMDYTGGYTINLTLATKLNNENYDEYVAKVEDIFENLTDDNGENYGVRVSSTQLQGEGESAAIYIKYKAVPVEDGVDGQALMEDEINVKLIEKLSQLFKIAPQTVEYANGSIKAVYPENISVPLLNSIQANLITFLNDNSLDTSAVSASVNDDDPKIIYIVAPNAVANKLDELTGVLTVDDEYSGQAIQGDIVSATVSGELLTNAIFAVTLALVLMLFYIILRFELLSGLASILALLHDLIMMFSFIVIFHIEINSTFIAAIITMLGYSINNSIIIFDRIRENTKGVSAKNFEPSVIANKSVNDTLLRSINTTVTTLITTIAVAAIGVQSIRIFTLPIIAGLLAGLYSSVLVAPSIWVLCKDYAKKRADQNHRGSDVSTQTK